MKKMGFSFYEMGNFTTQDTLDLIEMYIEDMDTSDNDEKVIYERQATQEEINAFFR